MTFVPFELEQWQSNYEDHVAYNLADSGVDPVVVSELAESPQAIEQLLRTRLHYPPVNGSLRLRELISALYKTADPGNVLVTVGAAEATAITLQALLEPEDHVVAMEPCYRQLYGIARNLGCHISVYDLDGANDWRPDLDQLDSIVSARTKVIGVTNPNNPTGTILTQQEMDRIIAIAARHNTWLLVDEVYRGSERLTDIETPSFYGSYDRVIAINSLSKAYGLSGLRTGWVLAPSYMIAAIHRRHEYAVISTGMLSMTLAELALAEPKRGQLLARNRRLIRHGYEWVASWVKQHSDLLFITPPHATALAFIGYNLDVSSIDLAHAFREKASVLVAPGSYFGIESHLRITHGLEEAYLCRALERLGAVLDGLR
jgi:aspartate/methionine/tyrosine aminotransferase